MPVNATNKLKSILDLVEKDSGIIANVSKQDIAAGVQGGYMMSEAIGTAIDATNVNSDGKITAEDLRKVSDYIRATPALYGAFVIGHGDDEGNIETGFHLVQSDGGRMQFQGRDFVDTIADAIFHVGFTYNDGRFRNEDGNANERVDDIAGWMNYFINGENRVYGTWKADTLYSGKYSGLVSDAADEIFEAGNGDDRIWAGDGDDLILAGEGDDTAGGGSGDDDIKGSSGDDRLMGDAGFDKIYGGIGQDVVSGGRHGDEIYGGQNNDILYGEGGNDLIEGGWGNDKLGGGDRHDRLRGGDGNDKIYGGDGDDRMQGNDDDDVLSGDRGHDEMYGGNGRDRMYGGGGNDVISGGNAADEIHGGDRGDRLYGNGHKDRLFGGDGYDSLMGGDDDDELHGHDGNDRLYGGNGNDRMYGGEGEDRFYSDGGADVMSSWEKKQVRDTFIFESGDTGVRLSQRDTIEGFQHGVDKIDLTGFDDLHWVGNGDFRASGRGEVSFLGRLVVIDENGDGQIDSAIEMAYVDHMSKSDFIL